MDGKELTVPNVSHTGTVSMGTATNHGSATASKASLGQLAAIQRTEMATGANGTHGLSAQQLAEVELARGPGSATIQLQLEMVGTAQRTAAAVMKLNLVTRKWSVIKEVREDQ